MAKTIGQLTQATTINGADELVIEQSGLTKRVAASVVRGGLVNADIDAAAAIDFSKLAALDDAKILVGNSSNVATKVAVTGDVTISNAGVTAIGSDKVLTSMIADDAVTTAKINDGAVTIAKLGTNEQKQIAKAWVNFNGTGTVSIRAEYNVSSITDNGTGDYTVNFTNALADANYAALGTVGATSGAAVSVWPADPATPRTTTALRIYTLTTAGSVADSSQVSVAVFR